MEKNIGAGLRSEQNHRVKEDNDCEDAGNRNVSGAPVNGEAKNKIGDENEHLRARLEVLRETVTTLKEELSEEKALWRKEMEEIASLASDSDIDSEPKPSPDLRANGSDLILASPIIRDYEEKISRYQGALAQAQAEKRFNIRRQIAANTYRKRLNEVEKLCREELEKVRETATHLEPLKQMASEWNKSKKSTAEDAVETPRKRGSPNSEGGDFIPLRGKKTETQEEEEAFDVPVKIDASLVVDEDASSEIKGKIALHIGSLPAEAPTICYFAKFD